ncbi:unnamed protein product [Lota lota]
MKTMDGSGAESPLAQAFRLIDATQVNRIQSQNKQTLTMLDLASHHEEARTGLHPLLPHQAEGGRGRARTWGTDTSWDMHIALLA